MSEHLVWQGLQKRLLPMVEDFPGVAGLYLKDLTNGQEIDIHGQEEFPTASSIKIHVLTRLLQRAEAGELSLEEKIRLTPELITPGSGVLSYLDGEVELSLLDIAILMIIVSDNTATNICIDAAGMESTNALLRQLGLTQTTLRRKMQDRAAIARGDENTSTPREMVQMLEHLHAGRPSPWVAERCLAILKKPKRGYFTRALPPEVPLASKPGGMERVRCDAGIVYLPRHPYAVAVMTKYARIEPFEHENRLVEFLQVIHETMVVLDSSNQYGQGIVG
jgi:beta-lactamase class A